MKDSKDHRRDELLEMLWHLSEHHKLTLSMLKEHDPTKEYEKSLYEFRSNGALIFDGENIVFSEKGKANAEEIIRRHRLAECLMSNVLGIEPSETEEAACEFEHILAPELVDSICTLLGHPPECPHGESIPQGKCCMEAKKSFKSAVISVTEMKIGDRAKIAFLNTHNDRRTHKLLAMGLNPGAEIKLHQTRPVLVVEVNNRQIALENSIGDEINVWKPVE
ncbi:MAG: metal-dependent transcriptional regulator [Thermodesulfovibrionia bacterium]|nr:metal-dependent transcriptional regulator [Thermodesulfovibrionia bacterium]